MIRIKNILIQRSSFLLLPSFDNCFQWDLLNIFKVYFEFNRVKKQFLSKLNLLINSPNNMTDYFKRRFAKDPSIVSRNIAGEQILVPIRQKAGEIESIFTLNEVASRIWELLDGEKQVEEIKNAILEEFKVSPKEAEEDLLKFLQQLEEAGAVRIVWDGMSAYSKH